MEHHDGSVDVINVGAQGRCEPPGGTLAKCGGRAPQSVPCASRTRLFGHAKPLGCGLRALLQRLGFPALATTSAGFAFSEGLPDSGDGGVVDRARNLVYIASITAGVDVPVSAGAGDPPSALARPGRTPRAITARAVPRVTLVARVSGK